MSALTKLSAIRLQEVEVLATECGKCHHPLNEHSVTMRVDGTPCRHYDWEYGATGRVTKQRFCKCKEFSDVLGEQLPGITP